MHMLFAMRVCTYLILRTYVEECCSGVVLYIRERVGACVTDL